MSGDRVKNILARHAETVLAAMDRMLPTVAKRAAIIDEAMRYSLFAGGKRLRPGLVLTTAEALGGDLENVLPSACAIEMIHTYSLIHDDLPSMDDDDLRRGKPTCHVQFDEGLAVLAGDALSNAAFLVIATETRDRELVAPLVRELAMAAGTEGMIGGQVLDMQSEGKAPDFAVVQDIHNMKTAALFVAAMRLGAIASKADENTLELMTLFGRDIGLAFQIMDDILDLESDAATLGKTAGKDAAQQKLTYPACIGVEKSREAALELIASARRAIDGLDPAGDLAALADYIYARLH